MNKVRVKNWDTQFRVEPKVNYVFDAELHSKLISILSKAWINLDATELINYIHPEFQYDSQWVFNWMDAEEYKDYIVKKFQAIKNSGSKIHVSTVEDSELDGQMIELIQDDKDPAFLRIKCAEDKIFKMDMCAF